MQKNGFQKKNPAVILNYIYNLYGEEREACDREREEVRRVLSNVSNILLNGCDLILDRTFDRIGFNRIDDDVFRKLVKARFAYPTSKAATV